MTITLPVFDNTVIVEQIDDTVNPYLSALISNYYGDGVASPIEGQYWLRDSDDTMQIYLNGVWIPFRNHGPGKAVIWCDDQDELIKLSCPDTGIASGGYNVIWPTSKPTASQGWRVASIDGIDMTMEWFTPTASSLALDGLTDVFTGTPVDGTAYAFEWNAGNSRYELTASVGGGSTTLDALTDTDIVSATEDDYLRFDGSDWVNGPIELGHIPDLSSLYALASHGHTPSDLTSGGASVGEFLRWNGASYVPVPLVAGDLPGTYLPVGGGTLTGLVTSDDELRIGHTGTLVFETADEANTLTISAPDSRSSDESWKLPANDILTAAEFVPTGFPTITDIGGLAFMAFNQTSGEAVWIGIEGGSGGKALLNGATTPTGSAGEIRQPVLTRPFIADFQNAPHAHDGSTGEFFIGGGPYDGDGSPTLDLFYVVDLSGGPLIPQAGGTGLTSHTPGALLLGGSVGQTIPSKPFVDSAENNGVAYTPMVELAGSIDQGALVWDDGNGTWAQGPVPTAIDVDSPVAGDLVYHDGTEFTHGATIPGLVRFQGGLEVGAAPGSPTPGSLRLYEGALIGGNHVTLLAPADIGTNYSIQLPTQGGLEGQTLVNTTSGALAVMDWGFVTMIDGETFDLAASVGGALLAYDGADYVPLAPGPQGSLLGSTGVGITYVQPAKSTVVAALISVEGATVEVAVPRAATANTLERVDVFTDGAASSVTFNVRLGGTDAFTASKVASGDGSVTSFATVDTPGVSAGDLIDIEITSVSGTVSEAIFQLTFTI